MSEEMESKYFLACLVAMHAICNKVPVQPPNAVAAGATDYANSLMEAVYGDNWKQG